MMNCHLLFIRSHSNVFRLISNDQVVKTFFYINLAATTVFDIQVIIGGEGNQKRKQKEN